MRFLAGIETEYGFQVPGLGTSEQVEAAMEFVASCRERAIWDYQRESPRSDMRGFEVSHLSVDPTDWAFEKDSRVSQSDRRTRADRVTTLGARFYNDHGHPEYCTPECGSLAELALHDAYGEQFLWELAQASDRSPAVYKNNSDFHGASYGTHECFLTTRAVPFEGLFAAVLPMLVVRQIVSGAGKVGSEAGDWVDFQVSCRADFMTEPLNAETLFRRPIFNTRDEPHGDPAKWRRLHVICGDANMMRCCTARKVGLVQLAIWLAEAGLAPKWELADPVAAFKKLSRDMSCKFEVDLVGRKTTTTYEILRSYLEAGQKLLSDQSDGSEKSEWSDIFRDTEALLQDLESDWTLTTDRIDWAAKRSLLDQFREAEDMTWRDPGMQALDLQYHLINREESLFHAIQSAGMTLDKPLEAKPEAPKTRAKARAEAVTKFGEFLATANWSSLTFLVKGEEKRVELPPDGDYDVDWNSISDVECFISQLEQINDHTK